MRFSAFHGDTISWCCHFMTLRSFHGEAISLDEMPLGRHEMGQCP